MGDDRDPFEGLVLDDDFVKEGAPEPPARTRQAHVTWGQSQTSWRQAPPSKPIPRRRPAGPGRTVLGVSWVFLSLVALFAGSAYASWHFRGSHVAVFGFVLTGWLLSLSIHEFAHAAVAFAGGDRTVAAKGYLTLDLRRYTHPVLSFLLPVLFVILGGIGLPGGAVWVDRAALRSRTWRSAVSLSGPAANLACAVAAIAPFQLGWAHADHFDFWCGLAFLGYLQLWALLLNLLPIPGLDGWGAIEPWLPGHVVQKARRIQPFAFLVLFFLVFSSAAVGGHLSDFLNAVQVRFHVPSGLASYGYYLFKFWQS